MSDPILLFWTAVAAVGASASAVVAAVYTAITYRLVRLQSDPHVIVYVRDDPDRPSIFVIVIENVGRDVASDVTFTSDRPIPSRAYGMDAKSTEATASMTEGPLIEGIPALGPGTERVVNWGQYGRLSSALGGEPIALNYTYRSGKRRFSGATKLEVKSYAETDASSKPMVRVAIALETTAKHLNGVATKLAAIGEHLEAIANRPESRRQRGLRLRR